ncbi:hypothetical protein ACHWQZ_G007944 [Mnemiopsis leidyi]
MNTLLKIFLTVMVGHAAQAEVSMSDQVFGIKELIKTLPNHHFQTCNLVLSTNRANFTTAESKCRQLPARVAMDKERGVLATINSKEANDDLTMLLNIALPIKEQSKFKYAGNRWVWTGLRKVRNTDTRHIRKINKRIPYNASEWEWYDGSTPEDFDSWNRGQPDQRPLKPGKKSNEYKKSGRCHEEDADCRQNQMRVNHDGKWDDAFAFEEHPYACDYRGKYLVSAEEKTWTEAKAACEAAGLNLATTRSLKEVEELRRALLYFLGESGFEACKGEFGHHGKNKIGKSRQSKKKKVCASATMEERWDVEHWAWTGGNDEAKEGTFRWTDGTKVFFEGFPWIASAGKDNKSKGADPGQNCLTISKWGEFDDSYREHKKPFACECPRG